MYWIYILRCKDNSLYTGITNQLEKRIAQHNSGEGAKYTRGRGPVTLVYAKKIGDRANASKEEYRIKKMTKKQKLELIQQEKERVSS